jgi:limonene-1,2-epoxide hydrolase
VLIVNARDTVRTFLAAVEARDVDAAAACFAPGASYQNVPHPPVHGPAGVAALLGPILRRSERVRWDVVTEAFAPGRVHLERVDRFWIDGTELAVACHAVIEVDENAGLITAFRDYVDLEPWRALLAGRLDGVS